ncbi:MAG: hypothetical protein H6965_07790 [Chromatiaceae bacterium]|nr:hypothetical protein [Chromatiaceae bacterium]
MSRSANNVLPESATHEVTGDGRTGFWVIGILINLSVMGWFLTWAVKEWRKKRGD